jgi:anti-anti-sigma factor
MEFKLVATTGRARGQAVEIRASKFFIGRHSNCQLRPDIPSLAGIHALIEERENRLFLRDFGAEGGTGINDRVLHAREVEVFDTDLIQVGPMVLTLSIKKPGETPRGLSQIPEGWPFLEGVEAEVPATSRLAPVTSAARQVPAAALLAEPARAVEPMIRPERFVAAAAAATLAPAAVTTQFAPATASASILSKTFLPKTHHGHRAIDCKIVNDVMVVSPLSPDLNEEETVSPVRYELRGLLEEDHVPTKMVIDMGNTRYLSSRAVGVLLAHYQGLERVGSTMRVCGVSKEIKPVLDQMRLSMLIDIYPSVEEAVQTPWD